jgi:hypothetical protein
MVVVWYVQEIVHLPRMNNACDIIGKYSLGWLQWQQYNMARPMPRGEISISFFGYRLKRTLG